MKRAGGDPSDFAGAAEALWPAKAESAIRRALNLLDIGPPTSDQLADLAEAVAAYAGGKYYAAMVLAGTALMSRSVVRERRSANAETTLAELKAAFRRVEGARRGHPGDAEA